ncbi:MAG TPA: hypothetical protein VF677_06180 [Flavobacterium sp.]|jgi:hypothetical protein
MDYYPITVDNKNKVIEGPSPTTFVKNQWDGMRNYHKTRSENENTLFDELLKNKSLVSQFQQECQNLFNTL